MSEASGTLLGLSSGPLGALLGLSWALLGPSWGPQGQTRREFLFRSPLGPRKIASWGPLGALLDALEAVLGPSWSHLEASRAHRKRKGEKANNIGFPRCLKDVGLSGASFGSFLATWSRLGAVLEPLGRML